MRAIWVVVVYSLLLLVGTTNGYGQDTTKEPTNRAEEFAALREQRSELVRETAKRQSELKELYERNAVLGGTVEESEATLQGRERENQGFLQYLTDEITATELMLEQAKKDRESRKKELETLEGLLGPTAPQLARIAALKEEIANHDANILESNRVLGQTIQQKKSIEDGLTALRARIAEDTKQLSIIEGRITELEVELDSDYREMGDLDADVLRKIEVGDAEGNSKLWISIVFAALVAVVIGGFFVAIWGKTEIIHAIFSNDSGIQFVTIFSLIIAIILFGIIGVLEGKELSALLGGLSGYILGRSSIAQKTPAGGGAGSGAPAQNPPQPAGGAQPAHV